MKLTRNHQTITDWTRMKIALIAPPYPLKEAPSPPLGLCYVAAACEAAGAKVRIFDFIVRKYTPEKLARELSAFQPDVVGATSVTMSFPGAADIIRDVKAFNPDILTMMGGPHVSFDIENTLKQVPEIDLLVVGEGEETLKELLPVLKTPEAWETVRGIAFRQNGEIIITPERPKIEDLDTLPLPSRHLLPMSRYLALGFPVSFITSRGCPNKCIFCLGRKMVGFKVRHRSAALVMDEIETILSYGFTFINIADDLFTANRQRVADFCDEIRKRNLTFSWSVFSRVNTIDVDLLVMMKQAGCTAVSFGIESGCEDMLKRVRKGITLDMARKAVAACRTAGMRAHASFMVGLPGESPETLEKSRMFHEELGIEFGYHFLCPFPGTTVRERIEDYDLAILTSDWAKYDADSPVVRTSTLAPEAMTGFVEATYAPLQAEFEKTREKVAAGTATETEILQVLGKRRMELVFAILSDDLIETHGKIPGQTGALPFDVLTGRIAVAAGETAEFSAFVLKDMLAKGQIMEKNDDDGVVFFWTHNHQILDMDAPPVAAA